MARFILVHGAFHGSWCWDRLVPLLMLQGHRVEAVDLPGLDNAGAQTAQEWLDTWTECVVKQLTADSEPAVLVGHSRGGVVISQVAEQAPEHVAFLVYLAALLVPDGETITSVRSRLCRGVARPLRLIPQADGRSVRADEHAIGVLVYSGCASEDRAFAVSRLRPEPVAGFAISPRLSPLRYGSVPRAYIECLDDQAIEIAFQRRMQEALPCFPVLTLDTDHAPYFSNPEVLAEALNQIVSRQATARGRTGK